MSHVACHMCTCHMSNAYVDSWDMLNNFCFHLYAQKSLFIAENCNAFFTMLFFTAASAREFRSHRAGSQLKISVMTGTFSWESHFGKFYAMRKIGVATCTFYPRSIREHWEHQCHIHRQYRSIVFGWLCSRFYQWVKCLHYEETGIDLGNKVLVAKAIFSLPDYFWKPPPWLPSKMITKLDESIFISSSS